MIARAAASDQRSSADIRRIETEPLVESIQSISVRCTRSDSPAGSPIVHLDHTPSPQGQQEAPTSLLPRFFGVCSLGDVTKASAPFAERFPALRVVCASTQNDGAATCQSEISFLPLPPVQALQLAATQLPNRVWAVQPWAPVPRRSPAAALRKARPLGPRATSLTASSIPASANLISVARPARRTRPLDPAQLMLSQGFCIPVKTQKDTTCSRKS